MRLGREGIKHNLATGGTRTGGNSGGQNIAFRLWIDLSVQQFTERTWVNAHQRLLLRNDPIFGKFNRNPHRRIRTTIDTNAIQNEQFAILNRKFNLHFFAQAMSHQLGLFNQFCENFRLAILK